ncbi:MAG: Trm112 family protein [Candidatus Aenigmatarchaeota archaeon]
MPIPKELLEILACPKCKGDLYEKNMFLVCKSCKTCYPILNEKVPDFLEEDSFTYEEAEKNNFKHDLKL